ncbi:probable serine/threonine-protein kinase ndrC [Formica exsecta]|uniref:probable serine/threonine-protein kinase ndrC n=1 Tax=Formica exsecta TaxID=72781 RepID=UPI001141B876|nr:probable serine/threonine-protein kinase ndrC [Formica exsecta]
MSDLVGNNSHSSSSTNTGKVPVTLPKSQPVRLLYLCESDEDDDDDESEEKPRESEDESDLDEAPNDSAEDVLWESRVHETADVNPSIGSTDGLSRTTCVLPRDSCANVIDTFSIQKINCASNKEECKDDVKFKGCLLADDSNKLRICGFKQEDNSQDYHSCTFASSRSQTGVVHNYSMEVALPLSSLIPGKGDYIAKSDMNKNLQPTINSARSNLENIYISDMLNKRKEEQSYSTLVDNKILHWNSDAEQILNLNKEDQRYKGVLYGFNDQANKDCNEEPHKMPTAISESASCISQNLSGNLIHPVTYNNSQYSTSKYEANEKCTPAKNPCTHMELSTPSLNEIQRTSLPTPINRLVLETPLKHLPVGSVHPNSCASHKQLFRSPQSKLSDNLSKSHIQTPSTILSSWCYNNALLEEKNFIAKDHVQISKNTICTPIVEKPDSARLNAKNVRRPLADAMSAYGDSSIVHPLESKPSATLHACAETKTVASELQQEDRNKKLDAKLLMQTEMNYHNDPKFAKPTEETKNNKQFANMPDTLLASSTKTVSSKNEIKRNVIIGSDTGLKHSLDSLQILNKHSEEDYGIVSECKNSHERYSVHEKKREEAQQIVDRVANMQFTIPSSIPPQRQGKTLHVKDKEYLILGSLGHGMSGEVLRVQDISFGELRAIKCVDLSKMDKESAQGCLDEISMLRKLQAPCVVRMFDYEIRGSMVFVVMEMGDTDLSRLLKSMSQEKQISLTMILYYWNEMLTAVRHIHDNGVIHSDLKPGNFLLVRGRLKLIDFGIASSVNSDMTSVLKSNTIGTLNYISPEALMDIGSKTDSPTHNVKYKISFKSDVWSLGCILYSLVYGHTPFQHIRSQWAKVNAITNPKPNILFPATTFSFPASGKDLQDHERTPPVLIDVMRKCLQHDPKARPTVSQLLQVQYVPTTQNVTSITTSADIPANILVKIKQALNEEEWRQLVQILDTKRHYT